MSLQGFSFISSRKSFYSVALGLTVFSIVAPFLFGTRPGIDMTGGVQIEYTCSTTSSCSVEMIRESADQAKQKVLSTAPDSMNDVNVYKVAGQDTIVVEAGFQSHGRTAEEIEKLKTSFKESVSTHLGASASDYTISRYVNIGESFGAYIKKSGYMTLTIAIIMISLYIQYAFSGSIAGMASWPFAVVTGVSLVHDLLITFGLYIATSFFFPEFKIDTFFFTAMLTILGYSINDTIVVMDRIRSNFKEKAEAKLGISGVIDTAVRDTLRRSLFTSLTILIVLTALFLFGPQSLRGFVLVLLYGTIVGTYSSICIASPLLYDIIRRQK